MANDLELSPEQVSLVLKRAAELDGQGSPMASQELIAIAAEAGLDRTATETAIREIMSSADTPMPQGSRFTPSLRHTVLNGGIGAILGVIAVAGPSPSTRLPAAGAALLFSLFQVLQHRTKSDRVRALFQNFVTWLGFAVGAGAATTQFSEEVMLLGVTLWGATSLIGLALSTGDSLSPAQSTRVSGDFEVAREINRGVEASPDGPQVSA